MNFALFRLIIRALCSIRAWRIPGTEEPGRLPSMGSHRVGHNWSDSAAVAAASSTSRKGGFPGGSDGKESACNEGDMGSILGWEDPLEEGMTTHSSILAWRIPWTEEPRRLQSMGLQKVGHDWVTFIFTLFHRVKSCHCHQYSLYINRVHGSKLSLYFH